MGAAKQNSTKRYHHGDLYKALVEAARKVINERGIHGLSLRACAAEAGVSHAAPTHHFKSLKGLLTSLATIAFREFHLCLKEAREQAEQSGADVLQASMDAYVTWANHEPQLFRLIFTRELIHHDNEEYREAAYLAYTELEKTAGSLCQGKQLSEPEQIGAELLMWSLVHGYAHLTIGGQLGPKEYPQPEGMLPFDLLRKILQD